MTFKTNNLRNILFLAVFCFFEGHFFCTEFNLQANGGLLYTDNSGAAFIYKAGAKINLPSSDSFFINAGYTGFTSNLDYVEGSINNIFFGAGNKSINQSFEFTGLFGAAADDLTIRTGSAIILLNNLNYNYFSFDFSKSFSDSFGFDTKAFVGNAATDQSNLYLLIGSFEIPIYGGGLLGFSFPYKIDLQLFGMGGNLASYNEKSDLLAKGDFSLFDIKAGKTIEFEKIPNQIFYGAVGFTYVSGSCLIRTTADSQNTIFFPFSYLYADTNATLYFVNLLFDYKFSSGNFSFYALTDFRINCRYYINYYYKYNFNNNLFFDGSKGTERESLAYSNGDFICKISACADYKIPKINTKIYLQKEFLFPVITQKTRELFDKQSENSETMLFQNKDELIKTILLSGLSIGLRIEF